MVNNSNSDDLDGDNRNEQLLYDVVVKISLFYCTIIRITKYRYFIT